MPAGIIAQSAMAARLMAQAQAQATSMQQALQNQLQNEQSPMLSTMLAQQPTFATRSCLAASFDLELAANVAKERDRVRAIELTESGDRLCDKIALWRGFFGPLGDMATSKMAERLDSLTDELERLVPSDA